MHEHAIAERNAIATNRSQEAAAILAERAGIPVPVLKVNVGAAGVAVARLYERERVADFLEQLAESLAEPSPATTVSTVDTLPRRKAS